jgi:hypothetical protein
MNIQKNPEFELRKLRNALLRESDWTQFNDSPLTTNEKQAWAAYRQELRDLLAKSNPKIDENNNLIGFQLPQAPK